jgi:hypothetical protein
MKEIWKFSVGGADFTIRMPQGAEVLAVQMEGGPHGVPVMWALVDPSAETESRTFHIFGTGGPFDPEGLRYVGTFQAPPFVWHLWEERPKAEVEHVHEWKLADGRMMEGNPRRWVQTYRCACGQTRET